jgi:hypothetical protein
MRLIRNAAFALTMAMAAAALAGCGGAASSAGSAGSGSSSAGGGSASSSSSASQGSSGSSSSGGSSLAGLTGEVNICSLMPPATIARITGKPFTATQRQDTPSYKLYSCNYTDKGYDQLNLGIEGLDASAGYGADLSVEGSQAKAVSGIGDKAFSAGVLAQLEVLYGNVLIKITGLTAPTTSQSKQIISQLHAKL